MGRILLGIILCLIFLPLAVLAWFRWGHPPVAVADAPFPYERQIVGIPLQARIEREMPASPPMQADEATLTAGAQVYGDQCAVCHGFYGRPSPLGSSMYPRAPQLWAQHKGSSVVGVSDDPAGETYWKIFNGIRLSGMPQFKSQLSETEIWQVTLLLANADKPLPPAVLQIVRGELPPEEEPGPAASGGKPAAPSAH
ncbi:MAG TPA: cytochrome c [Terracidiphilus sp.]|jgi:mono/diheme cytochrome c family protein